MATSINYLKNMLANKNVQAALHTIRKCEGTSAADGYNYLFGSRKDNNRRFADMQTHPNQRFPFVCNGETMYSSAAGAYQILKGTYDTLCRKYGFADFTAETQDLMALALWDTVGCLNAVAQGKFFDEEVLDKLNNIWASLPYAGYHQPEKSIADVRGYYTEAGGEIAA